MKNLKPHLFIFAALTCLLPVYAQKSMTKTIVDSRTRLPVDYVFIQSDDATIKQLSNKEGKFILLNDTRSKAFTFYKMGYLQQTIETEKLLLSDTLFMLEKPFELSEVVVRNNKTDAIVKDKKYYVDDYLALPNGDFILVTSRPNANGFEVCYYNKAKGIRQAKKIKTETDGRFVTDCFKNIHLLTNSFSRQIFFDSDSSFEFLPGYKRNLFDSALAGCVLKIDTQVIMKHMMPPTTIRVRNFDIKQNSPFLSYYKVSKHMQLPFYNVLYNARMQEMIDHEISDWILLYGGIDDKAANNINLFFTKIAGPIYAPMFLKNDTVVLFNFQENTILLFNRSGTILKEVPLNKQQFLTIHDFEIICDQVTQTFYLKIKEDNKTFIKRINIYTGTTDKNIKVEKVFASNIQVINSRIYYLVKEKAWDDTQYLYQQN